MGFSVDLLRDEGGRAEFDRALAAALGCGRSDTAEALLAPLLASLRTYMSDLCLTLPPAAVSIAGWETFNARVERLASDRALAAIGIDISPEGEASDAAGRAEQRLACVYFDDRCGYDFGGAAAADIVGSLSDGRAASWAGGFIDADRTLSTCGLAPLLEALRRHPLRDWAQLGDEEDVRANLSTWLADRLRHLRVHQALERALSGDGLAAAVPVIVATDAVVPCLAAVYAPGRIVGSREAEAEHRESERSARRTEQERETEEQVARWREQRAAIRGWRGDPDQLRTFVDYVELTELAARAGTPLAGTEPGHTLGDQAFERMIEAYRGHRSGGTVGIAPGGPQTGLATAFDVAPADDAAFQASGIPRGGREMLRPPHRVGAGFGRKIV
ncbi:hypothetical protein E2493_06115 [Sphingomonas parva]|uniref:Uncharacterized protein n=1 Tax=Sphingomonas parva TaxID=2555898 RepID=A0A4Y8ZSS7_9SPHN|nr:hypothetical protein [Sphingomonas parva]TFI59098.1 hypothetical protein E2493_06115 [Sphingomonas parva]